MNKYNKVEGYQDLAKSPDGGIINTNDFEYRNARMRASRKMVEQQRIQDLENKVERLLKIIEEKL